MNRKGNGMIVGLVLVLILLGIAGYLGSRLIKTTPTASITPTSTANIGDIDRSGAADEGDRMMIQKQIGCAKDQPCWNTTIGKTKDGDNPLYVYDLDLDKDGTISQKDVELVR